MIKGLTKKEYMAEHYRKNRESYLKRNKEWQRTHPEAKSAINRRWYLNKKFREEQKKAALQGIILFSDPNWKSLVREAITSKGEATVQDSNKFHTITIHIKEDGDSYNETCLFKYHRYPNDPVINGETIELNKSYVAWQHKNWLGSYVVQEAMGKPQKPIETLPIAPEPTKRSDLRVVRLGDDKRDCRGNTDAADQGPRGVCEEVRQGHTVNHPQVL